MPSNHIYPPSIARYRLWILKELIKRNWPENWPGMPNSGVSEIDWFWGKKLKMLSL
jgi:hypothetical protein